MIKYGLAAIVTLCFILGCVTGGIIVTIFKRHGPRNENIGDLLITTDEDGVYLSLRLNYDVSAVASKKEALVTIRNLNTSYNEEQLTLL